MASHFDLGLALIVDLLALEAHKAEGDPLAAGYEAVAYSCRLWEEKVAEEAAPAGTDTDIDAELALHATVMADYATWCDLAMVDPVTAQAQEPEQELPDQAETDLAHAFDDAYQARNTAANYLGI